MSLTVNHLISRLSQMVKDIPGAGDIPIRLVVDTDDCQYDYEAKDTGICMNYLGGSQYGNPRYVMITNEV